MTDASVHCATSGGHRGNRFWTSVSFREWHVPKIFYEQRMRPAAEPP